MNTVTNTENFWNRLVKLRDTTKDAKVKQDADRILTQMNTAGGQTIMKKEAELFLFINEINKPYFLKEWTPTHFTAMEWAIKKHFSDKLIRTLHGNHRPALRTFEQTSDIFGLAYTSSSSYAGYWVCNTEVYNENHLNHHYIGFAMDQNGKAYGILWDERENEIIIPL